MIDEGFDVSKSYSTVAKDTNVIGETITVPSDEKAAPVVFSLFNVSKFPKFGSDSEEVKQFFGKNGLVESAIRSFASSDNKEVHMHRFSNLGDKFSQFAMQSTEEFPSVFTHYVKTLMDYGINIFDIFKKEAAKSDLDTDMPFTRITEPLTLMVHGIIIRLGKGDKSFPDADDMIGDFFDFLEYAKEIGEDIVLGRTESDKKNALHLIAENDAVFPTEAMERLIDMFPHMLEEMNSEGCTPTEESLESGSGIFDSVYKKKLLEESLEVPATTVTVRGRKRF